MIQLAKARIAEKENFPFSANEISDPIKALIEQLVFYKFGCREKTISISREKIFFQTTSGEYTNIVIFSGLPKEMYPLITAVSFYIKSSSVFQEDTFRQAFEEKSLFEEVKADYEKISLLFSELPSSGMVTEENRIKITILYAAGITEKEEIEIGLSSCLDDLFPAIKMCQERACTLKEILNQKN